MPKMGVPQNSVVVVSFLGAAAAVLGAVRRWRRGRGQGTPKEEAASQGVSVDQVEIPGNVGESQVWTTGQGAHLTAVQGAWDSESSQKVVTEEGRDIASPQEGVSDDGAGQEGAEDDVSSDGGGQALNLDGQGSPTKAPKKENIIGRTNVSRGGSSKPGGPSEDVTSDDGFPTNGPFETVETVPGIAGESGKMQEEARGGVLVDVGLDKLDSDLLADDNACEDMYRMIAELQEAASEGGTKPDGAVFDRTEEDKKGESAEISVFAEAPDKKCASSPFMGMKRGFLSSGEETAPTAQKNEAAEDSAGDLEEGKVDQASGAVEGSVQEKNDAALVAETAAHAEVSPQDVQEETYSTPKKERYVDTEDVKDRGESPERTPTSVLNAFPNSPKSNNGGLPFAGPTRGGASGNAWKRGPIFTDRPGGSLEGGLLPLPARSGKVGGDKERHTLQSGEEGSGDKGAAGESVNEKEGVQRSLPEEGKGGPDTAAQGKERQEKPREGEQPVGESRQSESGSDTTTNANARKSQQNPEVPSSESTASHLRIDQGSNKASESQTLTSAAKPLPSGLQGSTTSQIGRPHEEESLEGFQPASEKHGSPQASPTPASHLPNGSNVAKAGSTDGSGSATKENPIQIAVSRINRLGWANSEQNLDGFDSATESFATPAASAPASPRVNQPGFANPKKETSAAAPPSKCEIEEVTSRPADTIASRQAERIQVSGVSSRETNGEELEEGKVSAEIAACTWCGHALGGDDDEELNLCCMLALQKLQEEAKAKKSGAIASKSGTSVASIQGVNGGVTVSEREKGKEWGNAVKEGGAVNGVGGPGKREKSGAEANAAKVRKVEAAALRGAEGTRWGAKVRHWLEGTTYSDGAR